VFVSHRVKAVAGDSGEPSSTWPSCQGDLTDEQWELIADLVPTFSGPGKIGRPAKHPKRDIVNAIFYVAATGCQWRALPACYPNCKTVHAYHVRWSRDGTWEAIVDRLRAMVREQHGRDPEPSAGIIDARSVQGSATVCGETRGFDAGKKVSGRKTFGVVDTLGLLVAVVVVAANVSDNAGGCTCIDRARPKSARLTKLWSDAGFKRAFARHCRHHKFKPEVVSRRTAHTFEVLPAAGSWNAPGPGSSITAGSVSTMNATPLSPKGSSGPPTPASSYAASPPPSRAADISATASKERDC
jgi:transposase